MNMINKYIRSDNTLRRYRIIDDIVDGKLDRDTIDTMCMDEVFNDMLTNRRIRIVTNTAKWSQDYLYKITEDAIRHGFNRDYLMHIYNVARYVRESQNCKIVMNIRKRFGCVKIILAGIIVFIAMTGKNDSYL